MRLNALLAVCVVVCQSAQQPSFPGFRGRIDQIVVDAVVTDQHDRPVTDLSLDDFEILEHGRPQTITNFQFVSIPARLLGRREMESGAEPPSVSPLVAAPVGAAASRLFVIVIDDFHLVESEIIPVKQIVGDVIESLAPGDEIAIAFAGRSDLGVDVTNDPRAAAAVLSRISGAFGFGLDALHRLPGGGGSLDALRKLRPFPKLHARATAFTLRSICAALERSTHARRAVLFISNGSAIDPHPTPGSDEQLWAREAQFEIKDAIAAARRANVPIYAIDPRGAVAPENAVRGGISSIGSLNRDYRAERQVSPTASRFGRIAKPTYSDDPNALPPELLRAEIARRIRFQQDYLTGVAIATGGRAFVNQSNLRQAVKEIVTENGSYYLLGYAPDPFVRDGRFHDIEIRVKRPGLRVRGRQGYTAPPPAAVGPGS